MGLLSETVIIKWNARTKKHYMSKGYNFTKMGDEFEVKVEDLTEMSNFNVKVKCDYCGKEFETKYSNYIVNKKNVIKKYSCEKCGEKKKKESTLFLLEHNKVTNNQSGYYLVKENRIERLRSLMDKIKGQSFDVLYKNKEFLRIKSSFRYYNEDVYQEIEKLGYSIEDNFIYKPIGYYDDFNNLKKSIENFIKKYNRFPMQRDFMNIMHISGKVYRKHGTIKEIRSKMNYNNDYDLMDDNGFCNRSLYEYYTAQFLINNNILYKREQHPFSKKEGNYRSDFMFLLTNGDKIHCEVWGCPKKYSQNSSFSKIYNEERKVKEELYKKYKIKIISIDCEIFDYKNYEQIDKNLYKIFKPIFSKKLKHIEVEKYIPPSKLTNEELLKGIMKFSVNGIDLPPCTKINNPNFNNFSRYYKEISRRFPSYDDFAKQFNKNIGTKVFVRKDTLNNLTNLELINEVMKYSDNKNRNILPSKSIIQIRNSNLYKEIIKRYKDYSDFANKNNLFLSNRQHNKLNEIEQVFIIYEYMINTYGKIISNYKLSDYKSDLKLLGAKNAPRTLNTTSTDLKLQFFQYCIENNKQNLINDIEKTWIIKIVNNKSNNQFKYTKEQQDLAKELLKQLNNMNIQEAS